MPERYPPDIFGYIAYTSATTPCPCSLPTFSEVHSFGCQPTFASGPAAWAVAFTWASFSAARASLLPAGTLLDLAEPCPGLSVG